jgi:hypothetical protein
MSCIYSFVDLFTSANQKLVEAITWALLRLFMVQGSWLMGIRRNDTCPD